MTRVTFADSFGGFRDLDRIAATLLGVAQQGGSSGPAFDLASSGENAYDLILAVPGYAEADLDITVEKGVLTIRGELKADAPEGSSWVHRGIPRGRFERRFALAEHVEVKDAELANGLLRVSLVREVPEALKPRSIAVKPAASLPKAA
jgi:molecular chaperone IbpA